MSLGWLTESSLIPKEPKVIKGVGTASLLRLQAAVFEREQRGPGPSAKRQKLLKDKSARNEGVEARNAKDATEKKVEDAGSAAHRKKLEEKAKRYEAMVSGRSSGSSAQDEVLVDFSRKRSEAEAFGEPMPMHASEVLQQGIDELIDGAQQTPTVPEVNPGAAFLSATVPPPACLGVGTVEAVGEMREEFLPHPSPPVMTPPSTAPPMMDPQCVAPQMMNPQVMAPQMMDPQCMAPPMMDPQCIAPQTMDPQFMDPQMMNSQCMDPQMMDPQMMDPQCMDPQMMNSQCMAPPMMDPQCMAPPMMDPQCMAPPMMDQQFMAPPMMEPPDMAPPAPPKTPARSILPQKFERPRSTQEDIELRERMTAETDTARDTVGKEKREKREAVRERLAALRAAKAASNGK
eukprot:TRINITY_DN14076_c1_g1_i1.p1 TRINITY_DN14076_c1_g1~~TRINITY_DN14076_c1_g1_i1.p1  ORF type:complete len:402 (-),score=129.06 TRINITY_DN14076_c1_g1_i1:42-1247(-)